MAEEQDIACEHWFTGLRLGRAQVDDASVRVSYRQASQVLHRALRDLPGPDTGLRLGQQQTIGNFGLLGLARSEEHTSELQSLMRTAYAVFLLNKQNQDKTT